MTKTLSSFAISPTSDGYLLMIEDEDGESFEFETSYEQLDLISEEIDKALDTDEEDALVVDEDEPSDEE
ncbi:hypothetical protein [Sphingomonas japonica]|uniref:DUF1292 domain-containing protein n=1 Tax=Sphingomonas japonica TaxID=511662 RepID=A0ABX0U1U4_9SPHN|nr:hypothetical protein [Sphingomonas japonica]NIJ23321.1 hypothetical protein [Sphingomonas japonica]